MSEELNRHEAELNEAALENVSGGRYESGDADRDAGYMCSTCYASNPAKRDCYREHMRALSEYLEKNGPKSVKNYRECPYYKS